VVGVGMDKDVVEERTGGKGRYIPNIDRFI